MPKSEVEVFLSALDAASHVVALVHDDQLVSKTPCSEWDVRGLLRHMVYEVLWVPPLLAGKTIAQVGDHFEGDILGDDCQKAWLDAAAKAREAVQEADLQAIAHLSYGDIPVSRYLREMTTDLAIHSWDLGKGLNMDVELATDILKVAHEYLSTYLDDYQEAGMVAAAIEVGEDSPLQEKLLAMSGRKPSWPD